MKTNIFQLFLKNKARAASNQIYVPELDRIVLGDKRGTRSFLNVKVGSYICFLCIVCPYIYT